MMNEIIGKYSPFIVVSLNISQLSTIIPIDFFSFHGKLCYSYHIESFMLGLLASVFLYNEYPANLPLC